MIKKLRRRLTIIFTALTGAILIAVLFISLWFSVQQAKVSSAANFSANSDLVTLTVISEDFDKSDLGIIETLEHETAYTISIKIDGEPVTISEEADQTQRKEIIKAAEEAAVVAYLEDDITDYDDNSEFLEENSVIVSSSEGVNAFLEDESLPDYMVMSIITTVADGYVDYPVFTLEDNEYRVNAIKVSSMQNQYEFMFVEDLSEMNQSILLLWLGYVSLMVVGILLLTLVNWFLSKLIVKPTAEGIKRQTEFVAAASHELRSPLAVLKASLSASEIADTPEEAEKYRSCAMAESERLRHLVDDLLLLAGSDSHKWRLNTYDFDVDTLLIDLHEQFTPIARERDHEFLLDLPEETLGNIKGDKDRIRQILGILIDNALEYSPPDTTVTLFAHKKKGKLYLEVSDEGPGLSEEDKKRIFQRFYRVDESRSDKNHFGLGLSIAAELAELHGGTLTVKDNPGGGSLFTLILNC